jgi:hypothetical protein
VDPVRAHDWFDHGTPVEGELWDPERPDWPGDGMRIRRTRPDPSTGGRLATSTAYSSEDTHWWGALERVTKRWGRLGKSDILFGLPG